MRSTRESDSLPSYTESDSPPSLPHMCCSISFEAAIMLEDSNFWRTASWSSCVPHRSWLLPLRRASSSSLAAAYTACFFCCSFSCLYFCFYSRALSCKSPARICRLAFCFTTSVTAQPPSSQILCLLSANWLHLFVLRIIITMCV